MKNKDIYIAKLMKIKKLKIILGQDNVSSESFLLME